MFRTQVRSASTFQARLMSSISAMWSVSCWHPIKFRKRAPLSLNALEIFGYSIALQTAICSCSSHTRGQTLIDILHYLTIAGHITNITLTHCRTLTQITQTLGSTSIRYHSDDKVSDRCLKTTSIYTRQALNDDLIVRFVLPACLEKNEILMMNWKTILDR